MMTGSARKSGRMLDKVSIEVNNTFIVIELENKSRNAVMFFRGLFLTMLLASGSLHGATIYKYKDDRGGVYFTDEPMEGPRYRLVWTSGSSDPSKKSFSEPKSSPKKHKVSQNRSRYAHLVRTVARRWKLSPSLLHAVIRAESNYNPQAISSAGAMGLMQLMPGTAERYGVSNPYSPWQNLNAGAQYLSELLEMFNHNLSLALAAYNAGENAVIRSGNKIPNYPETKNYVAKVTKFYKEEMVNG
jgi:hypothetical protein